jgi:hypothetical protein
VIDTNRQDETLSNRISYTCYEQCVCVLVVGSSLIVTLCAAPELRGDAVEATETSNLGPHAKCGISRSIQSNNQFNTCTTTSTKATVLNIQIISGYHRRSIATHGSFPSLVGGVPTSGEYPASVSVIVPSSIIEIIHQE